MNYIRTIRKERLKVSQADLAKMLGVRQATVSRWETGDPVDARTKLALDALIAQHDGEHADTPSQEKAA